MQGIRGIIRRVLLEAVATQHFADRVAQRLHNPVWMEPKLDPSRPDHAISLLKRVTFPDKTSIAVNAFRSSVVYSAMVDGRIERGNIIWVIINNNVMETVYFRGSTSMPTGVDFHITIDNVWNIIDEKQEDTITREDLERFNLQKKPLDTRKRAQDLGMPTVMMRGHKWYVDVENERFIYAKNTKKTMTFDDAFNVLPEKELDSILSQLPALA